MSRGDTTFAFGTKAGLRMQVLNSLLASSSTIYVWRRYATLLVVDSGARKGKKGKEGASAGEMAHVEVLPACGATVFVL